MKKALDYKSLLRNNGLRATPGRIAILNALSRAARPITVADLRAKIGASAVDQVTLYRTLETFISLAIVRRIDLQQGHSSFYELADNHHHHLICTQCGTVKDFEACDADKIAKQALRQIKGFAVVNNHAFELFGLCNACAA